MEQERKSHYQPPVERLLICGKPDQAASHAWSDYRALGIGPQQIPELIRMAVDEELSQAPEESLEVRAPVHAWRALGQLRAVEAIEPLLALFERLDDDWAAEEIPEVLGRIGPAALPILTACFADRSSTDSIRIRTINSVEQIGLQWPQARAEVLALLAGWLERFMKNHPEVNAFLVDALVELGAKESALLIKRAFAAGRVDMVLRGDWEDVQSDLEWKSTLRDVLEPESAEALSGRFWSSPLPGQTFALASSQVDRKQRTTQKRARGKMAKLSRKKNRKG